MYGVNTTNFALFASYLNGRKQHIKIIGSADIFLNVFVPIKFTNDSNLFLERSNVNTSFKTVNDELSKISEWFSANKLSLNVGKTIIRKSSCTKNVPF